jgi:hypothetical protein
MVSVAIVTLGLSTQFAVPALADPGKPTGRALTTDFKQYKKVPDEQLAKMRGGFVMPTGLLNFSVELAAQINGLPIYQGTLTFSPGTGVTNNITVFDTTGPEFNGVPVTGDVNIAGEMNQIVASVKAGNGNVSPTTFAGATGFVATVQNTVSNVAIQQEMRVRLDLSADHFLPSVAATQLRNNLRQVRNLSNLR